MWVIHLLMHCSARRLRQSLAATDHARNASSAFLTLENAQIVFVDTPGINNPRHKLGEFLNQEAQEALDGVECDPLARGFVDSTGGRGPAHLDPLNKAPRQTSRVLY